MPEDIDSPYGAVNRKYRITSKLTCKRVAPKTYSGDNCCAIPPKNLKGKDKEPRSN
jgi:hypothetical protein